ncbi:MAG: sulfotransferase [Nitrospira sp.]|nr:sulfotransferase [Nitrospira sp.]
MRPLFIGGYPKSGTTLLLSLLDGHPEVAVFPEETRFFGHLLPLMRSGASREAVLDQAFNHTGVRFFREGVFDDGAGVRDYSAIDFALYQRTVESLWASSGYSQAGLLIAMVSAYAQITGQDLARKRYWIEKSPGTEHFATEILRLFPEASFVYTLRDPRANYFSYRKKKEKYLKYTMSVEEFILAWIRSLQAILRGVKACSAMAASGQDVHNRYLVILYEELVRDPRGVMEKLAKQIGLSWDDCLMSPTRMNRPWEGNSMHGYAFAGVSSEPVMVWRAELDPNESAFIDSVLGANILRELGWPSSRTKEQELGKLNDVRLLRNILVGRPNGPSFRQRCALAFRVFQFRSGWLEGADLAGALLRGDGAC